MKLKEYQEAILPLSTKPDGTRNPIEVLGLGMGGEFGEIAEHVLQWGTSGFDPEKLKLELGDALWYIVTTDTYYGLDLANYGDPGGGADLTEHPTRHALKLAVCLGNVQDHIKKHVWHEKELSRGVMRTWLGAAVTYLWAIGHRCCGCDLSDIAEANVAKLRARWPQGFNPGGVS